MSKAKYPPFAISISDGHNEDWYYYETEATYRSAFDIFKSEGEDTHGYRLNDNEEYEVINSHSEED